MEIFNKWYDYGKLFLMKIIVGSWKTSEEKDGDAIKLQICINVSIHNSGKAVLSIVAYATAAHFIIPLTNCNL